jgi:hypothetical protein
VLCITLHHQSYFQPSPEITANPAQTAANTKRICTYRPQPQPPGQPAYQTEHPTEPETENTIARYNLCVDENDSTLPTNTTHTGPVKPLKWHIYCLSDNTLNVSVYIVYSVKMISN